MADDDLELFRPAQWVRCERCKFLFGRPHPALASYLRCPECDFPFGETLTAMRAIARAVQTPDARINVLSTVGCFVWLRAVPEVGEIVVEDVADATFGTAGEWLYYERDQSSWADILDAHDIAWFLTHRVCARQPFLLEFRHPVYSASGYEVVEYDVEYDWDIVLRSHVTASYAARSLAMLARFLRR